VQRDLAIIDAICADPADPGAISPRSARFRPRSARLVA
jgi:hypothetical protein